MLLWFLQVFNYETNCEWKRVREFTLPSRKTRRKNYLND